MILDTEFMQKKISNLNVWQLRGITENVKIAC